ncbi:hypothetical protein PHACT_00155 [Pseudohongiella acticola]|uniref:Glycosyl transferase family 1 domain-containing protein n=1 Tax=Pseudohongiella acticola TaxID=1524254 RepID=A0A1E8CH88_9GAMM|nr:glycosyltransferase family 1 protein [Pseudohongiella acticola]OFE11762.1 hypothetical protein PHACT_00155 [Pseudohongiella acticola]
MHLAIDASNLRLGGGVTHLSKLLSAADPQKAGIRKISVWACQSTAATLPSRPWLDVCSPDWIESGLFSRMFAQQFRLAKEVESHGCDILFSPGGTLARRVSIPTVTMSQNMLPFEASEAARFGIPSVMWLKMKLLRMSQGRSFREADGLIFLTQYAKDAITQALGHLDNQTICIPHGIETRFVCAPRKQRLLADCTFANPFRLLYVSIAMPYKHQIPVAFAVKRLRDKGLPVEVQFVGASWGRYGSLLRSTLDQLDPDGEFLQWSGSLPFEQLHDVYMNADAFVFASSCENLPNIMIEAMAAGLPIASSRKGPMPEVLGEAGVYFDPDDPDSVTQALETLAIDATKRTEIAQLAWQKATVYSWERCADETLAFIAKVAE